MTTPSATLLPLLHKAVEMRATGISWASVGNAVGRHAETCRGWPRRYPDVWRRLYRQAEREFVAEAGAEARSILRLLLRDNAPSIQLRAAQILAHGCERQIDREERSARLDPIQVSSEIIEFVQFLKGLPDDQLSQMLKKLQAPPAVSEGSTQMAPDSFGNQPQRPTEVEVQFVTVGEERARDSL